jgi:hypothetical protein
VLVFLLLPLPQVNQQNPRYHHEKSETAQGTVRHLKQFLYHDPHLVRHHEIGQPLEYQYHPYDTQKKIHLKTPDKTIEIFKLPSDC